MPVAIASFVIKLRQISKSTYSKLFKPPVAIWYRWFFLDFFLSAWIAMPFAAKQLFFVRLLNRERTATSNFIPYTTVQGSKLDISIWEFFFRVLWFQYIGTMDAFEVTRLGKTKLHQIAIKSNVHTVRMALGFVLPAVVYRQPKNEKHGVTLWIFFGFDRIARTN